MKSLTLLTLAALFSLSSCERVRSALKKLEKKPAPSAPASLANPATSDIPAGIREMLSTAPSRIVIVDFYADWCGPCRMLSPMLEKIANEQSGTIQLCKVNVDQFGELAVQQRVSGIPDVRIFADGILRDQFVGSLPEAELRKRIDALVSQLPIATQQEAAPAKPKEPAIRPMSKDWMPPGIQRR